MIGDAAGVAAAHRSSRCRRFARFVFFLAYGAAFSLPMCPSFFLSGVIRVIFLRSGVRVRSPCGRPRKPRKRAFPSLDAELIFMKVDALIAEKVGCLLRKRKRLTRDRESDFPFPGRLAKCNAVCRCRRSVCSGPFYCSTWPVAHTS